MKEHFENSIVAWGKFTKRPRYLCTSNDGTVFVRSNFQTITPTGASHNYTVVIPSAISKIVIGANYEIHGSIETHLKHNNTGNKKPILTVNILINSLQQVDSVDEAGCLVKMCGTVRQKPYFTTAPSGTAICSATITVPRDGKLVDVIPCISYYSNAKVLHTAEAGSCVSGVGKLVERSYRKLLEDGSFMQRTVHEVNLKEVTILS